MESFNSGASFVSPDIDKMECQVSVDVDGWDDEDTAYDHLESFAEGNNDMMGEEIEQKLAEEGLSLVYPGEVDDTYITFKMEKL
jgi:hypothetical protein